MLLRVAVLAKHDTVLSLVLNGRPRPVREGAKVKVERFAGRMHVVEVEGG